MDRMAILIGNDRGSAIVPMLEREGLRVEVMRSPEQALERLQEIMDRRQASFSTEAAVPMGPEEGNSVMRGTEEGALWEGETGTERGPGEVQAGSMEGGTLGLDRRLAAVQERARALESEEQKIISEALQHAGGNKTAASRLLGISRYALQRRLRRFAKPQNPI